MKPNYVALGKRLRAERRKNHLTQEQLAEKVDLSPSFLGHIERGSRIASIETLVAVCNELKVSPSILLQDSLRDDARQELPPMSRQERHMVGKLLEMARKSLNDWDGFGD